MTKRHKHEYVYLLWIWFPSNVPDPKLEGVYKYMARAKTREKELKANQWMTQITENEVR